MTKKTVSTSNVPNSNNGNVQQNINNTPPKMKNTHKNNSQYLNQAGVINSKHLHNQSHQQKPKKKKNENMANDGNNENILMKKLFEAVQKQKEKEKEKDLSEVKRTRKATAPLPKTTMNSSETYAGAAFDRAPAAASFPIPSFLKTGNSETSCYSPTLSSSCPLPEAKFTETSKNSKTNSNNLKSLSITDLFQSKVETETVEVTEKSEKKKLESLTNDLRKMLNLR